MIIIKGLVLGFFLLNVGILYADETNPIRELEVIDQYTLRNKADQEPVEKIDPVSGELTLNYTDFTIKGPGGLDINLVRQYRAMSASEHPYTGLFGMGWRMDFGRLKLISLSGYHPLRGSTYTAGDVFEDQSGQSHQFFKKIVDGKLIFISKDNWKLQKNVDFSEELKHLESLKNVSQVGFTITNPDGTSFHAGVFRSEAPPLNKENPTNFFYVHRIEDKYGNNIIIDWTDNYKDFFPPINSKFGPPRIKRIGFQSNGNMSSQLDFHYKIFDGDFEHSIQPLLTRITGKTKSIEFNYEDQGLFNLNVGNIFVPISARIKYRHPTNVVSKSYFEKYNYLYYSKNRSCDGCGSYLLKQRIEPNGLQVNYKWTYFDLTLNGIKGKEFQAAVSRKSTSGNIQKSGVWTFDYASKYSNRFGDISLNTVTTPTKILQYYYYNHDQPTGNLWRTGLMQKEVTKSLSGQVFQSTEYVQDKKLFISDRYLPYPPRQYDYNYYDDAIYRSVTTQIETIRDSDVYTKSFSNFNAYGAPESQIETGPTGQIRRTDFSYYINEDLWIINQPQDEIISQVGSIKRYYNKIGDVERVDEFNQRNLIFRDNNGNVKETIDANGNKTYYKNYKMGLPQRIEYPENKVLTYGVGFPGVIFWEQDGEGHQKSFSYYFDRITGITPPLGDQFKIDYISCKPHTNENCTGIQITRGTNQKKIHYDGNWNNTSVTENGQSHHFRYDAEGRKTFESYLGTATAGLSFHYDVLDRPIKITKSGGAHTTIQYLSGNRVKIIDENNIPTTKYYQSFGNPNEKFLERIDTAKNTTWIETDPLGLIKSVQQGNPGISPNGLKRTYTYNNRRQLIGLNNPETGLTTFGRDLAGNMTSKKVGNSPVTQFKYDGLDRLKFIQYPSKTNNVTITYNKNDQIKLVDNGTTQRTFGYDSNNNLKTEDLSIDSFTFQLDYNYNSRDQLDSIQYPSGQLVKYYPDARGRPTRVGNYVNSVAYYPNDIIKQVNYANNTQLLSTYNNRHLVETIKINKPGKTLIDLTYGYDPADNVKSITDALGNTFDVNLSYDKVYQLETANGAWGKGLVYYNQYGDITRKQMGPEVLSYTYNNGKLDSLNNIRYLYDAYGNAVSNHRADQYRFGDASELLSVNEINYWYDGGNTLVKKQAANGKITYSLYAYKNSKLLAEYDEGGKTIREYAYLKDQLVANIRATQDTDGDGVDDTRDNCIEKANTNQRDSDNDGYGNLCDGDLNNDGNTNTLDLNLYKLSHRTSLGNEKYNPNADFNSDGNINTLDLNIYRILHRQPPGPSCCNLQVNNNNGNSLTATQTPVKYEVTYYHWNALSSTVLATDSSGNKAWEENYLPYGKQIKGEEDERSSVFYTGKHTDRDTGLTYLAARWYDAEIGRFISIDPLTFQLDNPKSFGRYVYANNNPYKYVDPTGEIAETALDLVSLGFSLAQYKADPSIINGLGVVYDGIALAVPFWPGGVGILKNVVNGSEVVSATVKNVATKSVAPAKRASNQTVLGSYPDYVKLSDKLGARRFEIPTGVWNKMTPAQQWTANRKFLDRMISKGDDVILSNPASKAQPGTSFAREIDYLRGQGYRVSNDGLRMLPGK